MRLACIAFIVGVLGLHFCEALPSGWVLGSVIVCCLLVVVKRWWWAAFALAGFAWAAVDANSARAHLLPLELTGKTIVVTGMVVDLPVMLEQGVRFWFRVERIEPQHTKEASAAVPTAALPAAFSGLVRLTRYDRQAPTLSAGDRWRLAVRLRRPVGFSNPGGFDYERWSFQKNMVASGYVREFLAPLHSPAWSHPLDKVDQLRQRLADTIRRLLVHHSEPAALLLALTVGVRSDMSAAQWRTLQDTGTSHLMAISGLHVGLLAMLALMLAQSLWRRWYWGCARLPAQWVGAVAGLLAAIGYALVAGLSVPTQRALIMIAALMFGLLRGRTMLPGAALAAAACVIVALDPRAPLGVGFWLSFTAVAALQFLLLRADGLARITWGRIIRTQAAISLGIFPLLLFYFGSQPLLAPLVNLAAIPLAGWGIVPLALAGTAISTVSEPVGAWVLIFASWLIELLMAVLQVVAALELKVHVSGGISWAALAFAIVGVLWLGAPHPWPARWIGLMMLLPLLTTTPARPQPGQAWVTVLDVGQGLAVVIETAKPCAVV